MTHHNFFYAQFYVNIYWSHKKFELKYAEFVVKIWGLYEVCGKYFRCFDSFFLNTVNYNMEIII